MTLPENFKQGVIIRSSNPLLGTDLTDIKMIVHTHIYTQIYIEALFVCSKSGNDPNAQ